MQAIADAAEELEGDEDGTLDGALRACIRGFLEGYTLEDYEQGEAVETVHRPFVKKGRVWFRIDDLRRHMRANDSQQDWQQLVLRLKAIGGGQEVLYIKKTRTGQSSMRFWGVPAEDYIEGSQERGLEVV